MEVVGFLLLEVEVLVFEPVTDLTEVDLPPVLAGTGIFETTLAPAEAGPLATSWGQEVVGAR